MNNALGIRAPAGRSFAASFVVDNFFYIYGGFDLTGFLDDMWFFDISKNVWNSIALSVSPSQRSGAKFARVGRMAYLSCGFVGSNEQCSNDVWMFNIDAVTWKKLVIAGPVPVARSSHCWEFMDSYILLVCFAKYTFTNSGEVENVASL